MYIAEQKVRLSLTGNPFDEPQFQHEGEEVVRWMTGGTAPDVYVTFHHIGDMIEARCPTCRASFGRFPADYGESTVEQIAVIRRVGHKHRCKEQ